MLQAVTWYSDAGHSSATPYTLPFFQEVKVFLPYGCGAWIQSDMLEGELVCLAQDCSAGGADVERTQVEQVPHLLAHTT